MYFDAEKRLFCCKKCTYTVVNKAKMSRHLSRKTACDSKDPIPIKIVQSSDAAQQKYVCESCGKTFGRKSHYRDHLNRQDPCTNTYSGTYKILKTVHKSRLTVLDLFCGCGGFTKGLSNAGLNVVAGIDFWETAIASYQQNHDHIGICDDITKLSPELFIEKYKVVCKIDMIVGGPPCQGFSSMGNRDPSDPRNSLFIEFVKYVYYFLPKCFVMENVVGILSAKTTNNESVIDIIMNSLSLSYDCRIFKMTASNYDVPQERNRIFIIGIRKNISVSPTKPPETSKYNKIPVKTILIPKKNVEPDYFLSELAVKNILSGTKVYGTTIINPDKPCNTILAGYGKSGGYSSLVKYSETEIRKLTILELKRIQTFPDDYKIEGTYAEISKQIGNAVPCNLAYHIGEHIIKLLNCCKNCK
jgi:DNA (cytosine-5)-methyltransferase 1